MQLQQWTSGRLNKGIVVALVFAISGALAAFAGGASGARTPAQTEAKLEATIFSYDGHDFVRTQTTMSTEDGKSAVNTKLDRATPAYKALVQKHSFTGETTVFGRKYDAKYAPLTSADGKLTGALFVGLAK